MRFWHKFVSGKFTINKQLSKRKIPSRVTSFVLVPDAPIIPNQYLEQQDTLTQNQTEAANCEVINLGESTLLTLFANKRPGVCPRIIFFGKNVIEQPSNLRSMSMQHLLEAYIEPIKSERQRPLNFHIAAHGYPDRIGYFINDSWLSIEEFAGLFNLFITTHDCNNSNLKDKEYNFTFHTCNSAYCHIEESMSESEIKLKILNETLIGKFFTSLHSYGFTNVNVTGFRGYYAHMQSHKGACVSSDFVESIESVKLPADSAKFAINSDGIVDLPSNITGKFLEVHHIDDPSSTSSESPFQFELKKS